MLQPRPLTPAPDNSDRVEPVLVATAAEAPYPAPCDALEVTSLLRGDRAERVSRPPASARLHLNKRDERTATRHQIDLGVAEPETGCDDPKSPLREVVCRESLTTAAEIVSG